MSRLIYKGDTINNFGKFLPTPVIETIKVSSVSSDDPIVETINSSGYAFSSTGPITATFTVTPDQLTNIDIKTSAIFNSDDNFDSLEMFEELFDANDNHSLYINFIVYKDANLIEELKNDKLNLSRIREYTNNGMPIMNTSYNAELDLGTSQISGYITSIINPQIQVYSVPLSDYVTTEDFTSEFDDSGNQVIKSSYVDFSFHVYNMDAAVDMAIFACITSESLNTLSVSNLSKTAFAINFSDISYENVKTNGSLAKFGDPVYVDGDSLAYHSTPLRALDGKYYKSDVVTHKIIRDTLQETLNKYQASASTDKTLDSQINNMEYVLNRYADSIELIPNLYKANKLSPSKSSATKTGNMTSELGIRINKFNATLLGQPQVVRRIYRNYKILDNRVVPPIVFDTSYDEELATNPENFIYKNVLHANAAKYVPVSELSSFPGQAEIPITSDSLNDSLQAEVSNILEEVSDIVTESISAIIPDEGASGINFDVASLYYNQNTGEYSSDASYYAVLINEEVGRLKEFLENFNDRWIRGRKAILGDAAEGQQGEFLDVGYHGSVLTDVGRNSGGEQDNAEDYADASGKDLVKLSTAQFKEMKWWFMRDKMFDLVASSGKSQIGLADDTISGAPGHLNSTDAIFDNVGERLLTLRPPVDVNFSEDIPGYGYQGEITYDSSQSRNWNASIILSAINENINSLRVRDDIDSDTSLLVAISEESEGTIPVLEEVVSQVTDEIKTLVTTIMQGFINSPTLSQSILRESTREEISHNIYNDFLAGVNQVLSNRLSSVFDAYIRCCFYPDPMGGVEQEPDYYLNVLGSGLTSTQRIPYNVFPGLAKKRTSQSWIHHIKLGSAVSDAIYNELKRQDVEDALRQKIEQMLLRIAIFKGSGLDEGLCDTLANVDIIIKKSGYFFVDLEKYIRKASKMSRYINVDTLIDQFPGGRELTNNCINIRRIVYDSQTYSTGIALLTEPFGAAAYDPTRHSLHSLVTIPVDPSQNPSRPLVYSSAPIAGSTVKFNDIFDAPPETALGAGTVDEHSHIVFRNFAFPGFIDGNLIGDKTWIEDYRLALYSYQFFIDDDQFNRETVTVDGTFRPESNNSSRDIFDIEVGFHDDSLECLTAIINNYTTVYNRFVDQYYNPALDSCAYNDFTKTFNKFFVDGIIASHPDQSPWIDMISTYIMYISLFSNFFANTSYAEKLQFGQNILEQIRPETGTISNLINFNEQLVKIKDRLDIITNDIATDDYAAAEYRVRIDLETPILDHIGDYSDITARYSVFT
jgi:hypothetical protein|tara:strand:- start:10013 stop:13828 length:3816 start_codon:yes stop_codon:yes gene_type:complete